MIRRKRRRKLLLRSLVALDGGPWRHAWHTSARWNSALERWEARVRAGLVNGIDPTVDLRSADGTEAVEVPLADRPAIPLTGFRAVGGLGDAVPEFFLVRGVKGPPDVSIQDGAVQIRNAGVLGDDGRERQLRACDVVLIKDRAVVTSHWSIDTSGLGGSVATFSLDTAKSAGFRERARLEVRTKLQPATPPSLANLIGGDAGTLPQDVVLIATIYLLSRPGESAEASPDRTWTAFVKHGRHAFWNLSHGMNKLEAPLQATRLEIRTGLAGGVADALNALILSRVNDQASDVAQLIGRELLDTRFWTA
jgi:hypothetical protein